jgi:bacterial DNA-binding protein
MSEEYNDNLDKSLLEIKAVSKNESLSKREIVRIISNETKIKQEAVLDVLNAFVDIYTSELLTTGAWRYPGMGYVVRHVKKETTRKDPETGNIVTYPETCYLRASLPDKLREYHRLIFRNINKKLGNNKQISKEKVIKDYKQTKLRDLNNREKEFNIDDFY